MKLTDLDPKYWGDGIRILGISFKCPHCGNVRLGIAFSNPPDGGQPTSVGANESMPKLIMKHIHDLKTFDVPPGALWTRDGIDFDTMSLTPSIDASKSGHWHGFVSNGEIK